MASPKKAAAPRAPQQDDESPVKTALKSENGRAWLAHQLDSTEEMLRRGPENQGWRYNETLRASMEEFVEFQRALIAIVDSI